MYLMRSSVTHAVAICLVSHTLLGLLWLDTFSTRITMLLGLLCVAVYSLWLAYVHEAAHFWAAKSMHAQNVHIHTDQKGFRVTYELEEAPLRLALISVAGPISGVLHALLGLWAAAVAQATHPIWASWVTLLSILASLQMMFLLPFITDGALLWSGLWRIVTRKKGVLYETK